MCVEGKLDLLSDGKIYSINKGETLLLPASIKKIELQSKGAKVLEVYY